MLRSMFFSIFLFSMSSLAMDNATLISQIALELTTSTCPRLALYQECKDFCTSTELRSFEDQVIGIALSNDANWQEKQATNLQKRIDLLALNFTGEKERKRQLLTGYMMYLQRRVKSSKTFISFEESQGIYRL